MKFLGDYRRPLSLAHHSVGETTTFHTTTPLLSLPTMTTRRKQILPSPVDITTHKHTTEPSLCHHPHFQKTESPSDSDDPTSTQILDKLFRGYHITEQESNSKKPFLIRLVKSLLHPCWSITVLLPVILVLQILITAGVVFALSYSNSLSSVHSVSTHLVKSINRDIVHRISMLFMSPMQVIGILDTEASLHHLTVTNHPASGNLTAAAYRDASLYTLRLLHSFPSASAIYYGNDYGDTVGYEQLHRQFQRGQRLTFGRYFPVAVNTSSEEICEMTQGQYNFTIVDCDGRDGSVIPGRTPIEICGYDARTRPWYFDAKSKNGAVIYSKPYSFASDHAIGISVSKAVYSSVDDPYLGVVAVDYRLTEVDAFLRSIQIGQAGRAVIMTHEGQFLSTNRPRASSNGDDALKPLDEIPDRFLKEISSSILKRYQRYEDIIPLSTKNEAVHWEAVIGDLKSFIHISRLVHSENVDWYVVCILPEEEFLRNVYTSNIITISTTCVFVVLSIIVALAITGMIIFPLFNLGRNMKKAAHMQLVRKRQYLPMLYEVHQIQVTFASLQRALGFFKKFIPSIVIKRVMLEDEYSATRVTEAEDMSMMFADIEGFSTFAESLSPSDLLEVMSIAMESMSQIVLRNGGLVDAFVGDAIIALFGIPEINDDPQHATHAVLTGLECVRRMEELDLAWKSFGLKPLRIRVGVNSGRCCVGMLGSREKIQFSALGSAMNLAARLEPLNKEYGSRMLISEHTQRKVRDSIVCRLVDRVIVKGLTIATNVYEPICERCESTAGDRKVEMLSELIFSSMREKHFDTCFELIDQAMECEGFANDAVLERIRLKVEEVARGGEELITKMKKK